MIEKSNGSATDNCWLRIGVWGKGAQRCPRLQEVMHCHNCDIFHRASLKVLERPLSEDYRNEWAEVLSCAKEEVVKDATSVIIFRLGTEWVAIPTNLCTEITPILRIHSLPHNKSSILRGIVNINGEVQTCYSLGNILGIKKAENALGEEKKIVYERMIVLESHDRRFAFPVSEIGGIHHYRNEDLEELPATVADTAANYLKGIIRWGELCVGCLDEELFMSQIERSIRH